MVKIQQRTAKRLYLNKKGLYHYNRQNVCIIKEFHPLSTTFLKLELDEDVKEQKGSLIITLTPKKRPPQFKK